jgi:hypothetical protein
MAGNDRYEQVDRVRACIRGCGDHR